MTAAATLEWIESHVPERRVRVGDLADRLGLSRADIGVFRKLYGFDEFCWDPDGGLFDLLLPPARRALAALPAGGRVDYVLYAHTVQTVTPPSIDAAQVLASELGLDRAEAFAVNQQACVSSMVAVDVAAELLAADDVGGHALVVTGERAYTPKIQLIPHSAIMAEASAAFLVTLDGTGDVVRSSVSRTFGEYAAGLEMSAEEIAQFSTIYGPELAAIVTRAVDEAGLHMADIERIVPHNVSTTSWKQVIRELDVDPDLVFLDNLPYYGHCYSADVFLNYTTLRDQGGLVDGGHYVLASVGLGATFGAMVITHRARSVDPAGDD